MRLLSIELSGFRGFPQRREIDLNGDAVVVIGANGHGKTSLFDAILWALSGRIPRLHRLDSNDARLVSMYSDTGQARVELRLQDPRTHSEVTVTRSFDGKERRLAVQTADRAYQGPSAEGQLIELVWPDAASASDPQDALSSVLTRSVYLQQDLIRDFVEAASNQDRFAAVSELVGAGRVTELQVSLESAKRAWSRATNQREDELRPLRERLTTIEARLSESTARDSQASQAITPAAWDEWWRNLSTLGLKIAQVEPSSRDAPSAIDNAIKQLEALGRSADRRLQAFELMRTETSKLVNQPMPDIPPLQSKLDSLRKQLADLKRAVTREQDHLAEMRRHQAALKEKTEQLKALAALALKHLEDRCPVCAQTYDRKATRERLEAMTRAVSDAKPGSEPDKLSDLLADLAAKEKETAAAELALRSRERAVNERQIIQQSLNKRLSESGIAASDDAGRSTALASAIAEAEAQIGRVAELQRAGESLALRLAQSSAVAATGELRREAEALRRETAARATAISARNQTGEQAQRVIEALREAAWAVVEERLRGIEPLLQSIYTRIDPHPAFRVVTLLSQVFRGKGQLSLVVRDPIGEKECDLPAAVLSSSQVNALAVSVFLAQNIGVPKPPLPVAILDDPLQSLDDISLLGIVELLRRAKDRRQLLVSTHDKRFGSLLSRKLRPGSENGRTIVVELDGWSREGPIVATREVKCDPVRLRLVS